MKNQAETEKSLKKIDEELFFSGFQVIIEKERSDFASQARRFVARQRRRPCRNKSPLTADGPSSLPQRPRSRWGEPPPQEEPFGSALRFHQRKRAFRRNIPPTRPFVRPRVGALFARAERKQGTSRSGEKNFPLKCEERYGNGSSSRIDQTPLCRRKGSVLSDEFGIANAELNFDAAKQCGIQSFFRRVPPNPLFPPYPRPREDDRREDDRREGASPLPSRFLRGRSSSPRPGRLRFPL